MRKDNSTPTSAITKDTLPISVNENGEVYQLAKKYPPTDDDIALFMKKRDEDSYIQLRFFDADIHWESLLYDLVAADKFSINLANLNIANCVSEGLSDAGVGKNSKRIAIHYLEKWKRHAVEKYAGKILDVFSEKVIDNKELYTPRITTKSTMLLRLKVSCLKGSCEAYDSLKVQLSSGNMYGTMMYYSYIMADRYDYVPAKKDICEVANRFYKEFHLGDYGETMHYFLSYFK